MKSTTKKKTCSDLKEKETMCIKLFQLEDTIILLKKRKKRLIVFNSKHNRELISHSRKK